MGQEDAGELVRRALTREPAALRALLDMLTPVVQARVARAVVRSGTRRKQGRDLRQEVEDLSQEVFASLFDDGARALRAWDPARGLSLANFVGLVAEHQVASILRSGRRNPWTEEPTGAEEIDRSAGTVEGADRRVYSRQVLAELLVRLRAEVSPLGLRLFEVLVVQELPVEEVCAQTGMSRDAVYAWRSRLGKLVRRLGDEIESGVSNQGPTPRTPQGEERSAL
jgi:DNA-directed RNA polymerase specialized sigma24 family protein